MEMQSTDLLQFERSMSSDHDGDDLDDLFNFVENNHYMNYLTGPDVNLASFQEHISLPCLDRQISAESTIGTGETVYIKKSPWHESDSGVSTVSSESLSFVGENASDTAITGIADLPSMSSTGAASDDLMLFLFDVEEQHKKICYPQDDSVVNSSLSTSSWSLRKCSKRKFRETTDEFSDSEDSGDCQGAAQTNIIKSPNAVHCCNQNSRPTSKMSGKELGNVINVAKIVKPTACPSNDVTKDIVKLGDERSKNAQQAKLNREKKKAYIKNLEDDRDSLKKQNIKLSSQIEQMTEDMVNLETEVEYLKSVLANASALSGLLKNINNVKDVKLSTSLSNYKRKGVSKNDHSYNIASTRHENESLFQNAGVCLHVNNGEACLEFCAHCSSNAQKHNTTLGKS